MSSSLRNVAAFVPAPPLYFNEEETVKSVSVLHPPQHHPSIESSFHSTISTSKTNNNEEVYYQNTAGGGGGKSFQEYSPCSPSIRRMSTLDATSPSFKHSTPPTSPYPWKRMPPTPSSMTTPSTVAMTPESTTSHSITYLSTPLSSLNKNKPYAVALSKGTPEYRHYNVNNIPYHSPPSPAKTSNNVGYAVVTTSPTRGGGGGSSSPPKMPKKKTKNVSPTKRSPVKKKNILSINEIHNVSARNSPQPDDAANRKQRVKTELCMHYVQNKICPFGDNCTYAHGEAELQIKTLADLQQNCLIDDVENYRTKPCFNFVSMGSCPFGRRCNAIHDPRVAGDLSCWLPLTETQGNNIDTDINVEGLYQKRHFSIISGNPFGEQFSMDFDGWMDLYKLVTNTSAAQKRRKNTIPEVHKLSIAIQMRGTHEWMYKYRPQHVIFQDTCMVLQQRAFRLETEYGIAIPISMKYYKSGNADHVMVHELAFGPDSDPSVRGVALWFNIPETQVAEVAAQQAKRFRWRKTSKYDDSKLDKVSVFDTRECFTMTRPSDRDAFDLATKILEHRFATVKAERLTSMEERFEALQRLKHEKQIMEDIFMRLKRNWISWAYPINNGRQLNDANTPIPPVDAEYHPIIDEKMLQHNQTDASAPTVFGSAVEGMWRSFIATIKHDDAEADQKESGPTASRLGPFHKRLPIFVWLSSGEFICPDRSLPHITGFVKKTKKDIKKLKTTQYSLQSERCWRSLLLKKDKPNELSEWHMVLDHFQNFSRSKKVLTILQQ